MDRLCLACQKNIADTLPKYPALCSPCMSRAGKQIEPGVRVVCEVDAACSGIVERMADEMITVVRTSDGDEAWVPRVELVRVVG